LSGRNGLVPFNILFTHLPHDSHCDKPLRLRYGPENPISSDKHDQNCGSQNCPFGFSHAVQRLTANSETCWLSPTYLLFRPFDLPIIISPAIFRTAPRSLKKETPHLRFNAPKPRPDTISDTINTIIHDNSHPLFPSNHLPLNGMNRKTKKKSAKCHTQ
jgi:hypothetical protein